MINEIERKFLIKELPNLSSAEKITYERYYLFDANGIELRVQRKGSRFELERKACISTTERTREKLEITEAEFMVLKTDTSDVITRDSYAISNDPDISIKIYHGRFEGLIRVEVEFESMTQLEQFQPPPWFGREITGTPFARDAELCKLSTDDFRSLLATIGSDEMTQ